MSFAKLTKTLFMTETSNCESRSAAKYFTALNIFINNKEAQKLGRFDLILELCLVLKAQFWILLRAMSTWAKVRTQQLAQEGKC